MIFYTQEKERSHRFVLALRMGLPIFLMSGIALYSLFSQRTFTLASLISLSFLLLATAVYYLFFLINQSSYETITDPLTQTFSPEYFFKTYRRWVKKDIATLVMISIDNLLSINTRYGVNNGDEILKAAMIQINTFFASKNIKSLPICRYKGGDFILLLMGEKERYTPLVELFLAKYQENLIQEIEVQYSAVILDTKHVKQQNEILTRLYELQYANKDKQTFMDQDEIVPEELERFVMDALNKKRFSIATQTIYGTNITMEEITFKLIDERGGLIHQSRFIPYINRLGKIREFESAILEKAVVLSQKYRQTYVLNISSVTLRNGLFFQYALELLQRYPEVKGKIVLLFDEKEFTPQIRRFREQIAQYRAVGYKIALDKYGGNHTSMMYMREFEVDYVRFDPVFTRHIKEDRYQNILQGLNIAAHLCGAATWMSMIEDENADQAAIGMKINCRQGNYHGKITLINEKKEGENS